MKRSDYIKYLWLLLLAVPVIAVFILLREEAFRFHHKIYLWGLAAVVPVRLRVTGIPGHGLFGTAWAKPAVGCPVQGELKRLRVTDPVNARGLFTNPPHPTIWPPIRYSPTIRLTPLLVKISGLTPVGLVKPVYVNTGPAVS